MKVARCLALVALVALACAARAEATTRYLSPTGSNSNSCAASTSISTPKLTFASALPCLAAGDTLLVRGGTYTESIENGIASGTNWTNKVRIAAYPNGCSPSAPNNCGTAGEAVTVKPSSGTWTLYLGSDSGQPAQSPAYVEFDGINFDSTLISNATVFFDTRGTGTPNHIRIQNADIHMNEGTNGGGGAVSVSGSSDNEFINLGVHGLGGPYAFYLSGNRNLVDQCDMYDVASAGVHVYLSGGNPTGNIVRNSKIHHLRESWFFGVADARFWGILLAGTTNQAYNNLIYDNSLTAFAAAHSLTPDATTAGVTVYTGSSGNKVWNNTITGNSNVGINAETSATSAVIQNNIIYSNTGTAYINSGTGTTEDHNLRDGTNPLFTNGGSFDFTLQTGSPAKDAGCTSVTCAALLAVVTTDKVGTSRPQGGVDDIGAYEYVSAAPQSRVRIRAH